MIVQKTDTHTIEKKECMKMKLNCKNMLALTAALAALTAFPLSANAADSAVTDAAGADTPVSDLPGDTDCDGRLSIADAILFGRYLGEDPEVTVSMQGLSNANVVEDDYLNAQDLIRIMQMLASSKPVTGSETASQKKTGSVWLGEGSYKQNYEIGEPLDIMDGTLYGQGNSGKTAWHLDGDCTLGEMMANDYQTPPLIIDDSEFDSSRPGVYTIRLHLRNYLEYGDGAFQVTVGGAQASEAPADETKPFCGVLWVSGGEYRTMYEIGEELDIMNAALTGIGDLPENADPNDEINQIDRGVWRFKGHETLAECAANRGLVIDTSDFDNTTPGEYTIRLRMPSLNAEGFFKVYVSDSAQKNKLESGEWYGETGGSLVFQILEPEAKLTYRVGEALALDTIRFYGSGYHEPDAENPEGYDWDIEDSYVSDYIDFVDASEFDSTTPGVYRIRMYFPDTQAEGWFEVRVIAE